MKLARTRKQTNHAPLEMIGGTCPGCGHEVFITAYSAIVLCPKCDTNFGIESNPPEEHKNPKTPRGLPAL